MTTEVAAIRDRLLALMNGIAPGRGIATVRKTPVLQIDEGDCPVLSVFIAEDVAQADDDVTAGPPHFVHETTYHLAVLRNFAAADTLDGAIDDDMDAIQNAVLRDPSFNRMVEGVLSMRRVRSYPTGPKGTLFVELRFEVTVQVRTLWNPVIPDMLAEIDVTSTAPLPTDDSRNTTPLSFTFTVETA